MGKEGNKWPEIFFNSFVTDWRSSASDLCSSSCCLWMTTKWWGKTWHPLTVVSPLCYTGSKPDEVTTTTLMFLIADYRVLLSLFAKTQKAYLQIKFMSRVLHFSFGKENITDNTSGKLLLHKEAQDLLVCGATYSTFRKEHKSSYFTHKLPLNTLNISVLLCVIQVLLVAYTLMSDDSEFSSAPLNRV